MDAKLPAARGPVTGQNGRLNRLTGWKAIGQYLGCTARTARRWEAARSLPVHRIPGGNRGSVWAAPEELQTWLATHESLAPDREDGVDPAEATAASAATLLPSPPIGAQPVSRASRRRPWALVLITGVCIALAISAGIWAPPSKSTHSTPSTSYDDDPAARSSYLDARFELAARSPASLDIAKTKFLALTQQFPSRPAAWCGLADTYLLLREFGSLSDAEAFTQAGSAARRALDLDSNLADAWLDSAFIDFWWNNNATSAFQEFATALRLNPESSKGYHWYATALQARGDNSEALAAFARARALDPGSRAIVADEGWTLFEAGRRGEGERQLERLVRIDPAFVDAHEWLARVYLWEGRDQDFLREAKTAATLRGQQQRLQDLEVVATRLAQGGRAAMLGEMADEAQRDWVEGKGSAMAPAVYKALAGDRAGTLHWIATAEATHDHSLFLLTMPVFKPYEQEPIYVDVVAQLR